MQPRLIRHQKRAIRTRLQVVPSGSNRKRIASLNTDEMIHRNAFSCVLFAFRIDNAPSTYTERVLATTARSLSCKLIPFQRAWKNASTLALRAHEDRNCKKSFSDPFFSRARSCRVHDQDLHAVTIFRCSCGMRRWQN